MDNYKAITLLLVISKVLEGVNFNLCDTILDIDNLQFGFKCGIDCPNAILALKSVINHFIARGNSIFIASLDVSKAFHRVNHFKLFNYLLDAEVPITVVVVLCNWYAKMSVAIRWNKSLIYVCFL